LTMDLSTGKHPDDESVERYVLGSMSQPAAMQIEEHFLVCQVCRENVRKMEEYIQGMRGALGAGQTN
jgi:hypothetical protein